jgi:hypothetical protein
MSSAISRTCPKVSRREKKRCHICVRRVQMGACARADPCSSDTCESRATRRYLVYTDAFSQAHRGSRPSLWLNKKKKKKNYTPHARVNERRSCWLTEYHIRRLDGPARGPLSSPSSSPSSPPPPPARRRLGAGSRPPVDLRAVCVWATLTRFGAGGVES